jgi:Flp pilus assembly protein TadD
MTSAGDDARVRARSCLEAGDFSQSLEAATAGLRAAPEDVELLVLAGRAGVELDAPGAPAHLRRATELAPEDASAWHFFGEALAAEGSMDAADAAFRRAVELNPDDQVALSHLGHTSLAAGRDQEGMGYLARAADSMHEASTAVISLVDVYRSFGQHEQALTQARRLAEATPEEVPAWLDVADLCLTLGRYDEARGAFERLRVLDDVPGHEVYPLLGLILVELRCEGWERAREAASQAKAIDPRGVGADVISFFDGGWEGSAERVPSREDVERSLDASLAEYRRMHADDRLLRARDLLG